MKPDTYYQGDILSVNKTLRCRTRRNIVKYCLHRQLVSIYQNQLRRRIDLLSDKCCPMKEDIGDTNEIAM